MKNRIVHIILLLLCTSPGWGQYRFNNPIDITLEDGLPHNWVYDFEEDQYGFIWIATYGGLCRFDGTNVLVLGKNGQDSVQLPSERIRSLLRTGDTLWIGTFDGAAFMNLTSGAVTQFPFYIEEAELSRDERFRKSVRSMYQDRQGNIWMAPAFGGFVRVDPRTHAAKRFPLGKSAQIPEIHSLMDQTSLLQIVQDHDKDSIFWGITFADLVKLNTTTGKIERFRYHHQDHEFEYNLNRYLCIYSHTDGNLYMGARNRGLVIYNPASGKYIVPFLDNAENWPPELNAANLHTIVPRNNTELYLTFSTGIYIYDTETKQIRTIKRNSTNSFQTQMYGITYIDSAGRIWHGVPQGVRCIDPMINQYDQFSVDHLNTSDIRLLPRDAIEDFYPGYITIVGQYGDGIYHINPVTGHTFKTPVSEAVARNQKYFHSWGIAQTSNNELIISENRQLFYYKKGMKTLEPYSVQPKLQYASISSVALDQARHLWVGSANDDVWMLDLSAKTAKKNATALPGGKFVNIFSDTKGNIWGVTDKGHAVIPARTQQLQLFEYEQDTKTTFLTPENFCQCPNGEIWVAGNEDGIGLLSDDHPEKGMLKKIILQQHPGRNYIATRIACDQHNNLWVLDIDYLVKINKKDWSFTAYNYEYGLNQVSSLFRFLKNGNLLIGSRGGIYIIDPDKLTTNQKAPKPYVQNIRTNKGDKLALPAYLQHLPLQLSSRENVLTIEFSAINHTLAKETQFRYKLVGADETWNDPGKNRSITYSNLRGGDYIFQLKAANNEGIWSDEIYELPIYIGTPWHKTTIFYLMLGALGAAMVLGVYRYRVNEIRKEESLQAEFEKQIANVEMSALRAQMNPHFIFNCLNSIDRYIIKNDTKKASEYLNNFGRLIRLILQNSRSNYVNLKDELEALELYMKLEQMRFRNSFDYEIHVQHDINPENYEIPPMLIQPYVENAIWHGLNHKKEKGKVMVSICIHNDIVICTVEDNGIGRAASKAMMNNKEIKRQSMGMNITSERMAIINKLYDTYNHVDIIDLYNDQGNPLGTRVILNISL